MLPFTAIPFVRSKSNGTSRDDKKNKNHINDEDYEKSESLDVAAGPSDSSEFYSSVLREPSQSSGSFSKIKETEKYYRLITPASFKELHDRVCNDDIESVKSWFSIYVHPNSLNYGETKTIKCDDVVSSLCDSSGCNIAMTAAVHRSYETLKFLLSSLPALSKGRDNHGNSFRDVVESMRDENLDRIMLKHCAYSAKPCRSTELYHDGTNSQSNMFCDVCKINHSDPDHDLSISHLLAENRPVPEINPHLNPNNAGYKMMSKLGWTESKGLGPSESGRKYLIKTQLKTDRRGLGIPEKNTPKVSHFEANDVNSIKDNLLHKRKAKIKTENKQKRKRDIEKSRQWEIDFRRSMNEYE